MAELRLFAATFAEQPRVGIGGRSVGLVGALLAVEVALGIVPPALAGGSP